MICKFITIIFFIYLYDKYFICISIGAVNANFFAQRKIFINIQHLRKFISIVQKIQ